VSTHDGTADTYVVPAAGGSATRLMLTSAADIQPAWSANGDIVFVSVRHGNAEIYALDLATRAVTRLTTSPGLDISPSWRPL